MVVHVPTVPARSQRSQPAVHARSQQTPSAAYPDWQAAAEPVEPLASFAAQALPAAQ
jgi:hypothetical protein